MSSTFSLSIRTGFAALIVLSGADAVGFVISKCLRRLQDTYLLLYLLNYLLTLLLTYLITYLLTPYSTVLLEKLTGLQLVKKFPTFYGTRRFITAFTSARHLSLS
jgi:hypothetical protein